MLQKLWVKLIVVTGILTAIAYLAACFLLYFLQTRFIFFPSSVIEITPKAFNRKYQDVWIPVLAASGKVEKMHGWWIPAATSNANVLLYLHGNGVNIGANAAHADRFHQMGFAVLIIDYRGYGLSEGSFPTEKSVYLDATTAWDYLVTQRHIQPSNIFIYGHSLGGAIAIDLAVQQPQAAGIIIESSFTSIQNIVNIRGQFRLFPVNIILNQHFDSINKVKGLQMPVLFIHGTDDFVVPVDMSKQLYAAAPEPKQLIIVPNAGHNDVAEIAGLQYFQIVNKFVRLAE
ncbi:alpha/beta hydrolase [Aliterella atlantica]|uniref:Phospholipase n=1 Tax=Aliterella atlantica CENA595 TaxID=1618023 RepID=A0A0D8ZTV2_9CYAN|nr:alpha/beta fold hydrolase [Aliterella atlantica]KJH72183.1 phospholipase [Aliterella atlantica CENA595]